MKKSLIYMLLVVFCVMFTACMSNNVYKSKTNNFSISYPQGWEKKSGAMGTEATIYSPNQGKDDKYRENIDLFAETKKNERTLDQYFESVIMVQSKKLVEGYTNEKVEKTTLSGEDAYKLSFSINISGVNLDILRYIVKHNDKFYVLTFSVESSQAENYTKQMKEILESFKFVS
ncbi:MAG TPA: hypothetical protein DCP90_01375 [Clostridiales bacterium]|nr:MAG: hypothetical protein A2Y22_07605 [Clostridiales bacterium GWD2_32_59]HAN09249.1 hypothetical protein [Clostridiales bacterium]